MCKEFVEAEYKKLLDLEENLLQLSMLCEQIAADSKFSKEDIARRMGTDIGRLDYLLGGMAYRATLEEFLRFLYATGHRSHLGFTKK